MATGCAAPADAPCRATEILDTTPERLGRTLRSPTFTWETDAITELSVWMDGGFAKGWTSLGTGRSFAWTPDGPLDPDTRYTVEARTCGVMHVRTLRTLPTAVGAPDARHLYVIDLRAPDAVVQTVHVDGTLTTHNPQVTVGDGDPQQPGLDHGLFGTQTAMFVEVVPQSDTAIQVNWAMGEETPGTGFRQFACVPPLAFPDTPFDFDPAFETASAQGDITVGAATAHFDRLQVSGFLNPEAGTVQDLAATAYIDLDSMPDLYNSTTLCPLLERQGGSCQPCLVDATHLCWHVRFSQAAPDRQDDLSITPDGSGDHSLCQ